MCRKACLLWGPTYRTADRQLHIKKEPVLQQGWFFACVFVLFCGGEGIYIHDYFKILSAGIWVLIRHSLLGNISVNILFNTFCLRNTQLLSQWERHCSLWSLPSLGSPSHRSPKKCQMFIRQHICIIIAPLTQPQFIYLQQTVANWNPNVSLSHLLRGHAVWITGEGHEV